MPIFINIYNIHSKKQFRRVIVKITNSLFYPQAKLSVYNGNTERVERACFEITLSELSNLRISLKSKYEAEIHLFEFIDADSRKEVNNTCFIRFTQIKLINECIHNYLAKIFIKISSKENNPQENVIF
ncbi:2634_t:CDS:2 [Funneliformis geosporum]|uniref:2634_t:CDS:1 n=1 Tax=Funneliformis geosporum TaxID=1117311 RepID=A0A9W4WZS4_9GLOM|nr:2634_t:CDS:2 [Funneliformis geosporum]